MPEVVLLGDSIFDNAAYVGGAPDVVRQLREELPEDWGARLAAVDGSVIDDVVRQLGRVGPEATHLALSVGGNDALSHVDILDERVSSSAETLERLAQKAGRFERDYARLLERLLELRLPTSICTIYHPAFPDPTLQRLAVTALTVFNDAILRLAFSAGVAVLDLRLICDEAADYANPIEPSERGGRKIARALASWVRQGPDRGGRTTIFI